MLKQQFNPNQPYRYVRYARMSSHRQNQRSPEQQLETIAATVRRNGFPWQHVRDFEDRGISGRFISKRAGFQSMIEQIKTSQLQVDLILVDTFERFGRAEEVTEIRRLLLTRLGVLVLTADSNFADPTTAAGKTLVFAESFRSTEETRTKAHNVLRGKRDTVKLRKWPGGSPPFGYMLKTVLKNVQGRQEIDYSELVPNPETSWIIKLLFEKARESGWGMTRLAKFLNANPDIPDERKPFSASTVGLWLRSSTYIGNYVWESVNTEVVDDRRIYQRNPEAERIVVEDFCDPLVDKTLFDEVQVLRLARSTGRRSCRQLSRKILQPLSRGVAISYALSGLVRCGNCGRAMVASGSSAYLTSAGDRRRYVGYACPAAIEGSCFNRRRVAEGWIRKEVVNELLGRLGLLMGETQTESQAIDEIVELVNEHLRRKTEAKPSQAAALEADLAQLSRQIAAWGESLGRHDLSQALRRDLEARCEQAYERRSEVERLLREENRFGPNGISVDRNDVVRRLQSLHEAVLGEHSTRANLELARHVDRIDCFSDERVVVRICKLGLLPDMMQIVENAEAADRHEDRRQRRRGRLALNDVMDGDINQEMFFALDPARFSGLADEWFWIRELRIPRRLSWAEEHAEAVAFYRLTSRESMEKTAAHFGKTVPTIRAALRIAKRKFEIDALGKELSLPTRPNWPRDNARAVGEFLARPGATRKQAAIYFKKSLGWIKRAYDHSQTQPPDPPAVGTPPGRTEVA